MLAACTLPISEAATDWSVVYQWFLAGDTGWFKIGLSINLVSGAISGLILGWMLLDGTAGLGLIVPYGGMKWWKALPLGLLVGLPGLAPPAWAAIALYTKDVEEGPQILKAFKAAELVFEALPQSILQCVPYSRVSASLLPRIRGSERSLLRRTYVGVAYGRFDPSGPEFSLLLPVSVAVSLLGAGSTAFGFEVMFRNEEGEGPSPFSLGSRYGIVALLLHTVQAAALIFWIALLGCAVKGGAWWAMLLAVLVFFGMVGEAAYRGDTDTGRCLYSFIHLGQPGDTLRGALLWGAVHLSLVGGMAAVFFETEPVDNNYANESMPAGGPGSGSGPDDPQYFDCHERTSGLYPAYLATALCVVLTPLYLALD
eukprot:COSAG04_NODE_6352_length_1349_cov_1.920800_1_plen_368_part_10